MAITSTSYSLLVPRKSGHLSHTSIDMSNKTFNLSRGGVSTLSMHGTTILVRRRYVRPAVQLSQGNKKHCSGENSGGELRSDHDRKNRGAPYRASESEEAKRVQVSTYRTTLACHFPSLARSKSRTAPRRKLVASWREVTGNGQPLFARFSPSGPFWSWGGALPMQGARLLHDCALAYYCLVQPLNTFEYTIGLLLVFI